MQPPDPRRSLYLFASGRKGAGKSEWCRAWFDDYPFDRLVIDPTGDVKKALDDDGEQYTLVDPDVIPTRFPRGADNGDQAARVTLVYVPDMGSPTNVDDMDRVIGLALDGADHPVLLWIDEVGSLTTANSTPPNTRRVLHHGRHHGITLLGAAPRPIDIDGLFIGQADLVATFSLPNPRDRRRVADNIGADPGEFDRLVHTECVNHEYLLYVHADRELIICPPLPPRRRGADRHAPIP